MPDAENAVTRAIDGPEAGRLPELVRLAGEFNAALETGRDDPARSERSTSDAPKPSDEHDSSLTMPDALVEGTEYAEVAVLVSGTTDGDVSGLAGSKMLGFADIRGRVAFGETLRLVKKTSPNGDVAPVARTPLLTASAEAATPWSVYEIGPDGATTLTTGLAPDEVDAIIRSTTRVNG